MIHTRRPDSAADQRERLDMYDDMVRRKTPGPLTYLSYVPDRLLMRRGFDPEALVRYLGGARPSLVEIDRERKRRDIS